MEKKWYVLLAVVVAVAVIGGIYLTGADAEYAAPTVFTKVTVEKPTDMKKCYACHAPIKELHAKGKHVGINCAQCHTGLDKHLADVKSRPTTAKDQKTCGACHGLQYESFFRMNWKRLAKNEKAQPKEKAPAYDYLMMPHGFTREHNLQRSHAFMLIDHLLVDRAYGGRFQPKAGWAFYAMHGDLKAWDVLMEIPEAKGVDAHKPFLHGTGAFANPVCLLCKTQDHILDWAYMGDPVPGAKWSRVSKVFEMAKDVNHPMNCYTCHDPHSAQPRIVRDALIDALTRPEKTTLWHKDPKRTKIEVKDMGVRGYTRKIAILEKYDTKLQCGQCHVEYNCNPGLDPVTGAAIGMADRRSNYYGFVDIWEALADYDRIKFRDFRHGITGAALIKVQHPEVETFWNSKHHKAGADCKDCHMPKIKDPATGTLYTSHWQTNPKNYIKEACLGCHKDWTETQAKYVIESVEMHLKGKARKAEHWLTQLINKFIEARAVGVDEAVLKEARKKHDHAHIHWEWWTAETSAGFHNIDQAKESLNTSMIRSMEGIAILEEAIKAKRGTDTTFTTPDRVKIFRGVGPVR